MRVGDREPFELLGVLGGLEYVLLGLDRIDVEVSIVVNLEPMIWFSGVKGRLDVDLVERRRLSRQESLLLSATRLAGRSTSSSGPQHENSIVFCPKLNFLANLEIDAMRGRRSATDMVEVVFLCL